MESVSVSVGLDYHQETVQVCVMDGQGRVLANRGCLNDWKEIATVVPSQGVVVKAAVEACCGAAHLAEELMNRVGWTVTLAHPGLVSRMKQNPDKSDRTDAWILADLMRLGYLPRVWLAPGEIRELRRLVRYRQQLVDKRRNVKLRIRAILREHRLRPASGCRAWTVAWLQWLRLQMVVHLGEQSRWVMQQHLQELKQLNGQIHEAERRFVQITADDVVVEKLLSIEGIGPITAVTMRAEIGRFDRFDNGKQVSRYCGLSPRNASSGQRQADAGLVKAGNPRLRAVIIEAAQRLIRYEGRWRDLASRLRGQGKPYNVTVAAVANRWIRWLHHQMQPDRLIAA